MISAMKLRSARRPNWVIVRRVAVTGYLVVLAIYLVFDGIPLDRFGQFAWIIGGLATVCIGRPWRAWVSLIGSWVAFGAVLTAYDYSRGLAYRFTGPSIGGYPAEGAVNPLGMPLHVTFPIRFDEFLFHGTLPTLWVQAHLHPGHAIIPIAIVVSLTYMSHFLVMPITAAVLWIRRSPLFRVWLVMAGALAVVGLAGYVFYPMSPPWLASSQGYIPGPRVWGLVGEGWQYLGIKFAASLINDGRALANPVAAMPSLHLAYSTLAAGFFFFATRKRWIRVIIWLYPPLMGFSLVYGGEHYVTDEIFGVLAAAVVLTGWRLARAWRQRRALVRAAQPVGMTAEPALAPASTTAEPAGMTAEPAAGPGADPAEQTAVQAAAQTAELPAEQTAELPAVWADRG